MTVEANLSYRTLALELMAEKPIASILYSRYKIIFDEGDFFIDTGTFISDLKEVKKHKDEFKISYIQKEELSNLQLPQEVVAKIDRICDKILPVIDLTDERNPLLKGLTNPSELRRMQEVSSELVGREEHRERILDSIEPHIKTTSSLPYRISLFQLFSGLSYQSEEQYTHDSDIYKKVLDTYKDDKNFIVRCLLNKKASDRIPLLICTEELRNHYTQVDAYIGVLDILDELYADQWDYYGKVLKKVVPQGGEDLDNILCLLTECMLDDLISLLDSLDACPPIGWSIYRSTILEIILKTPKAQRTADFIHNVVEIMDALPLEQQEELIEQYAILPDELKVKFFQHKKRKAREKIDRDASSKRKNTNIEMRDKALEVATTTERSSPDIFLQPNEFLNQFTDSNQLARIRTSLNEVPEESREAFIKNCESILQNPKDTQEKLAFFCLCCLLPPTSDASVFRATHSLFKMVSSEHYAYIHELVKCIDPEQRGLAVCQLERNKDKISSLEHLRLIIEVYINMPAHLHMENVVSVIADMTYPVDYTLQLLIFFAENEKCTEEELLEAMLNMAKSSTSLPVSP